MKLSDFFDPLWCRTGAHVERVAADCTLIRRPGGESIPACRECWAMVVREAFNERAPAMGVPRRHSGRPREERDGEVVVEEKK